MEKYVGKKIAPTVFLEYYNITLLTQYIFDGAPDAVKGKKNSRQKNSS